MASSLTATVIFAATLSSVSCFTTVYTPSGFISGTVQNYKGVPVKAYLGIPFAEPPIGKLRYLKPMPVKSWRHIRFATKLPPGCPQYQNLKTPDVDDLPGHSMDCLYLNIWVPSPNGKKKTVMFYLHIGGFSTGSSRLDFYNGRAIAAEGDVIIVTTNYRLGVEGFLNSHSEDAPGNMGMYDMIESLKWVRQNIEYFGGDKDSITLFGTSSGGIAIGMFTISPLTRGLFKRAIMESGSPTHLDGEDKDNDFKTSKKVAETVGCINSTTTMEDDPKTVVECLRGKDAMELEVIVNKVKGKRFRVFDPTFGNKFLPENPRIAMIKGHFEPVDLMIGSQSGDGSNIITARNIELCGLYGEKNPQINRTLGEEILKKYLEDLSKLSDIDAALEHYFGRLGEYEYDKVRYQLLTAVGDYSRICPSVYFAESMAKKTPNVFYYFLTNIPSYTPWAPWMLSVHHDEALLVFGYPLRYPHKYSLADQILSRRMIRAWTTFAKTGHPGGYFWPPYSKQTPFYQNLNSQDDGMGIGPHRSNCNFYRETFGF